MSPSATSTKSKLTFLETVYPPISNQEAVWLQNDPEVEALLRQSDFYMIGGRAEAKYLNLNIDPDTYIATFDFAIGDEFRDPVEIRIRDLPGVEASEASSFWIEGGEKNIRIWDGPIGEPGSNVLEWFTTEKLIWDRSRGRAGIERFDRHREAATYDLLYVGIAKVGDSFDRLINNGHKARMEILGNEPQRYPGARVTDEIYLFLFNVQPLIMTTFELYHDFENEDFSGAYDQKRIVADAEKAFVNLLKPEYNVVKFASYPKGADGLYGSDFVRYGYAICEGVSFNTAHGRIRGSRDTVTGFITNDADSIFVEGNTVKLFVSGVDFPAEPPLAAANAAQQDNQKEENRGGGMINRGSEWHRWEPHIHAPGTLFNNQFKGPSAWSDYLTSLEQATPVIRAIAVTDYYCADTYQDVVREMKENGRLPQVALVFPNVELRLDVATVKERWTNIHLLVCPDDPKHVAEVERFLSRLRFEAFGDNFACTREDLAKLGRKSKPELSDERAAFRHGASQFKVNFGKLREEYGKSDWAKENILIAVAGAETDGTSGIRDANDATLRQEIEKFAHVIFAGSPAQRDFWLGRKSGVGEDVLRERYDGCKPCLHGSDAHEQATVAKPDGDRYSWIKGALEFDALRQAYIDPAGRAYVGAHPPFRATPARVIGEIELTGADWAQTPKLALNPGLVAIIGARGSGKTALADAIAAGCDATDGRLSNASFIVRAREHLGGVGVRLAWETGDPSVRPLLNDAFDPSLYPRARYLSQKFVEELCSADGLKDELLSEIERVIFEAHSTLERDGATDFGELLELRTTVLRDNRSRDEDAIATLSDQVGLEREKQSQITGLKSQITQKEALIAGYIKSRDTLVTKGSAERIARLNALTEAADHARTQIRLWSQETQALRSLQNDVSDFRTNRAPMALRTTKQNFVGAHLDDKAWEVFRQTYAGNVDGTLTERLSKAEQATAGWRGKELPRKASDQEPYVADDAELKRLSLGELEAEIGRIQRLINIDTDTANRLRTITSKIGDENAALKRLKESLADCEGAATRTTQLQSDREQAYLRVFESIVAEEQVLHELYRPLMDRLAQASGTLRKLSFSVSRHADVHRWATEGEGLFDKRRTGPFKGVGTLETWADTLLKPAWESGDPTAVAEAMAGFRQAHQAELLDLSEVPRSQQADYRSWLRRFAKWLYGTSHIEISYSIDYEAVDIRKLSPGTRGIVLLLLYLALDDSDDRPLIIDQPEENLDPKSIFDELVELFIAAKNVRQVIMVTHNANLVVNTDADQVIVAFSGTHTPGKLPPIRYLSGGLESAQMRKHVCDILEGGDRAFKERARRLRVRLDR